MARLIKLIVLILAIPSCGWHPQTLLKYSLPENRRLDIRRAAGCCGCIAMYYDLYLNDRISEQFVIETNCNLYMPTKHVFNTDSKGKITTVSSYVAVMDETFEVPVTKSDLLTLGKLDSVYRLQPYRGDTIYLSEITGFKKYSKYHPVVAHTVPPK